jgi:DME family drug/metabolite transporter
MNWSDYKVGVIIALLSAVCFALSNTLTGLAYKGGVTPMTLSATRFFLPTVVLFIILFVKGAPIIMSKKSGQIAIVLGVITIIYNLALLLALERLPVPIAILIFFLFPIITGFVLTATGAEAFTITKLIGTVVALLGLALVLGVSFHQLDGLGILLATIGAIGLATVSVLSHHLIKGEDPRQAMLYIAATALAIMTIAMAIRGEFDLPANTNGWIGFLLTNILYAAGMISYFYAISMAGAGATTFFVNLEPLVVTGAAFLLLGQTLTPLQLFGVLIVVGALIFYARSGSD